MENGSNKYKEGSRIRDKGSKEKTNDFFTTLSVDGDDLTIVKNWIYLTWHQKNMISVNQILLWMVSILVRVPVICTFY